MPRTITARLILAFLLVSITGVALAAGISYWLTQREFMQLFYDQTRDRFVAEATQYYLTRGSWQGVEASLRFRSFEGRQSQRDPGATPEPRDPNAPRPERNDPGRQFPSYFALADRGGRVLIGASGIPSDTLLTAAQLSGGTPVEVNDDQVGTVVSAGLPPLGPLEESYLNRTNRALLYAAAGSTLLALFLGIFLARTLTHPLRDLTVAIRAMAGGDLKQVVKVSSTDELGALAAAFNHMSADLDTLTRSRRQMTADIAHDLRTPLTVIGGYMESMRDGVLKPTQERLAIVGGEVQHLQRLVNDLGTLAQAEAGELRLNREGLDPAGLLRTMAKTYQPLAEKQGITVAVEALADLPRIDADPDRLTQVFGNLVTNALRHTPKGGVITFRAQAAGNAVALTVSDTGEGIAPEDLPRVFDRFYRGDTARTTHGESGLGLAIAKSIVEMHGGTIAAESAPGQGATMRVTLPIS
jgi:signal transduction histidine kinase